MTVVLNNKRGLARTIESIRRQTFKDFEHVIVDGKSSDGTVEYLEQLEVDYPFEYISERDFGLYDAMNKGLSLASGDYVLFLNSSDVFVSDMSLEDYFRSFLPSGKRWGYGVMTYVSKNGDEIQKFTGQPFDNRKIELGLSFAPHPATFVERVLLTSLGGFDPTFGLSADQELVTRIGVSLQPHVSEVEVTKMETGGAHSTSSMSAIARRYRRIRLAHGRPVFQSQALDLIFTFMQGAVWTARHVLKATFFRSERL